MESKLARFKSQAQRAKFYVLKSQGKMSQKTIDEWERDTPKNLPERIGPKNKKSKHSSGHWKDYTKRTGLKRPRIKRMRKTAMEYFRAGFEKHAGLTAQQKLRLREHLLKMNEQEYRLSKMFGPTRFHERMNAAIQQGMPKSIIKKLWGVKIKR